MRDRRETERLVCERVRRERRKKKSKNSRGKRKEEECKTKTKRGRVKKKRVWTHLDTGLADVDGDYLTHDERLGGVL
jgi:hypothetical protein